MYVGNTLLKQKPRLRVRNANLTGPDQTPSSTDPANNSNTPSRKANSLPSNNFKLNPSTTTTSQPAYESDLTRVASTDQAHRSDMEQVLYRAARLRRRRDRSKSNETITRRSKSENHQATECKFTPPKAVRIIRASDYQNTFSAFFRVFQSTSHRNYNPCLDPTRRTRKRIVARIWEDWKKIYFWNVAWTGRGEIGGFELIPLIYQIPLQLDHQISLVFNPHTTV